jgi:bis(5'-nucleosidyl)-tetraphosphatase
MNEEKTLRERSFGIIPSHIWNGLISFLLVHERAGHWGLPKGHPEPGESEIETARREFIEESGIFDFQIIEGPTFIAQYRFERDGNLVDKSVKYFLALVAEPKVNFNSEEIAGYGWFTFDDAIAVATYEETRKILRDAKEYIKHNFGKQQ